MLAEPERSLHFNYAVIELSLNRVCLLQQTDFSHAVVYASCAQIFAHFNGYMLASFVIEAPQDLAKSAAAELIKCLISEVNVIALDHLVEPRCGIISLVAASTCCKVASARD